MGQDVEGMGVGERVICFTLFICLAVAVLSTVSLFYLTAIVYVPVVRELSAGWNSEPVFCTTIMTDQVDCLETDWVSCYEWCISDPGGYCTRIWAEVREKGTDIAMDTCTKIHDQTCPTMKDPPRNKTYDCKNIDKYACGNITAVFQCDFGLCRNLTHVYDCRFEKTSRIFDCRERKNCINITGLVSCDNGLCSEIDYPWNCERKCSGMALSADNRNTVLLAGDRLISAHCQKGEDKDTGEIIWDNYYTGKAFTLFASCTSLEIEEDGDEHAPRTIYGHDCINGSALPRHLVPHTVNYTTLHSVYQQGIQYKLDPTNTKLPFDVDIVITKKAKLKINDQGCVNTLQAECTDWLAFHTQYGANSTASVRYPCYTKKNDTEFVVTRHDSDKIKYLLMLFLSVPMGLWAASCCCVLCISCCIKIDNGGHFRVTTKPIKVEEKPNARPRSAWSDGKKGNSNGKHQNPEMETEKLIESNF